MKYLRLVSDLHLDFDVAKYSRTRLFNRQDPRDVELHERLVKLGEMGMCWLPPELPEDGDTVLVIAGDIWVDGRFIERKYPDGESWIKKVARQFKYVVLVLGNHDYWSTNVTSEPAKIKRLLAAQGITNTFLLEKSTVVLDQVKFVGGTLWTDVRKGDPMIMNKGSHQMNDYRYTRIGSEYRKLNVFDTCSIHADTRKFIFDHCKRDTPDQTVVVVTHMAPSYFSVPEQFRTYENYELNYFYFSDLDYYTDEHCRDVSYWLHGHVHSPADYQMEPGIRVICNPRGYGVSEIGNQFDPLFRVQL